MKYLVLFSLISLGLCDPGLLGTDECTYGPSYWCSHIAHAQKCGAIQHCKDTVWKNQKIEPKDTVECSICKIGIEEVKNILKQNGTEAKIKAYLQQVCDLLSEKTIKDECNSVIKNYLPVILDLLKSNMTAEQICATIKMCTGFEDKVQHREVLKQELKVKASNACKDCEKFFTDVQNMIVSNETKEQIIGLFKQTVCAQLGPIEEMCNFVVEEYVPDALQYLGSTVDPDVTCRLIGFCTGKDLYTSLRIRMQNKKLFKQYNKKSIGGGDENCDICKNVMTDVQSLDQDPTTQDKIKDFVKKELCGHLGDLANECDDLVDQFAPQLFELLANELDPETVCSFIGFCRKSEKNSSPPALVRVHLTKSHPIKALSLLPAKLAKPVKTAQGSPIECSVCKIIMNELDSILAKNATTGEIEAALDAVCARLPSGLSDQCKAFITQYAPAILALLQQELNPDVVCDKLGICTPTKPETKTNVKANVTCILCEFVLSELEREIAANRSRAGIQAALDKICSLMPDTITTECTAFVKQYSPLIIDLLLKEVQPKKVCKTIRLCTSAVRTLPLPVSGILLRGEPVTNKVNPVGGPEGCLVCETLMNYLDEALKENRTEAAIKSLLMRACEVLKPLGDSWEQECEGIITAFGDEIVKMLAQEMDPKEICTAIGLCTSAETIKKLPKKPVVAIKEKPYKSAETCVVCEALLQFLDKELKGNRTEAAIKALLMRSCEVLKPLGESYEQECQGIVTAFGDVIIKMLTQELDPSQVCTEIGLCTGKKTMKKLPMKLPGVIKDELKNLLKTRQKVNDNKLYFKPRTNLGKKKCGFGPSYWCKSLDTAKECGMEEHCKRVWSKNRA